MRAWCHGLNRPSGRTMSTPAPLSLSLSRSLSVCVYVCVCVCVCVCEGGRAGNGPLKCLARTLPEVCENHCRGGELGREGERLGKAGGLWDSTLASETSCRWQSLIREIPRTCMVGYMYHVLENLLLPSVADYGPLRKTWPPRGHD